MAFDHLILQITDNCPLECAYCCVESGPKRTQTMPLEDALRYLDEAKRLNPDFFLSFTGGEPFSRFALMRDIAERAHSLGIWHTTITSAVWCKSYDHACRRLEVLRRFGLRTISISHDSFHMPWVSAENVENCVRAAVDLGIRVLVAGSITRTSRGARDLLPDLQAKYPEITVSDGAVQPTGRGADLPREDLYIVDYGEENLLCPVPRDLLVLPEGTSFPCCSTGGDYGYLAIGDARRSSLGELRAAVEAEEWFGIITTRGFGDLEAIVQSYFPEVEFPRRHIGVCNLCSLVFNDAEIGCKVSEALDLRRRGVPATPLALLLGQVRAALRAPVPEDV